jgi:hypothetical protein
VVPVDWTDAALDSMALWYAENIEVCVSPKAFNCELVAFREESYAAEAVEQASMSATTVERAAMPGMPRREDTSDFAEAATVSDEVTFAEVGPIFADDIAAERFAVAEVTSVAAAGKVAEEYTAKSEKILERFERNAVSELMVALAWAESGRMTAFR